MGMLWVSCVCVIENKDCPPNARKTIHLTRTSLFGCTSCFWSDMKVTPHGNQFPVDVRWWCHFYTDAKDAMRLISLSTNKPEAQSFRILWICPYPSFQSIPTHLFTPQQISCETGINREKQQCLLGRLRHWGVLSRLIACRHERNLNWLIEQTSVIWRDSATKTTQCGLSAYMQCFWKRNRRRLAIKPARRNGIRFFREKSVDNTLSFNKKKNVYYTWTHAHSSVRFVLFSRFHPRREQTCIQPI